MLILGIESTCDETAIAIVRDGREIICNQISSQADLHSIYGGVVPELACRRHIDVIRPLIESSCAEAGVTLEEIDAIAAAYGPGLIGAILIGLNMGKALAFALGKPFIAVNHIEAHLYAPFMDQEPALPALGVIVSGGHTNLIKVNKVGEYEQIGDTIDDAVGEAFDKVAKMLELPYPGGPHVEKLALEGDPKRFPFRAGRVKGKPYHFSFSGLKTAVLYAWRDLPEEAKADVAASFQHAALSDIAKKAHAAAEEHGCRSIVTGGGVTFNKTFRSLLEQGPLPVYHPGPGLSLDNAAMIAGLAYPQIQQQGGNSLNIKAKTRIPLGV